MLVLSLTYFVSEVRQADGTLSSMVEPLSATRIMKQALAIKVQHQVSFDETKKTNVALVLLFKWSAITTKFQLVYVRYEVFLVENELVLETYFDTRLLLLQLYSYEVNPLLEKLHVDGVPLSLHR